MSNCKTCKHWGNLRASDKRTRLKTCDHPLHIYGYNTTIDKIPDDGILVEDDEGWGMLTGPMFGCVHYQSNGN
jgi:hypothetical protein